MRLKVHREQWTFPELQDHFKLKEPIDLRRLVMAGNIRPALYFSRDLLPVTVDGGLPIAGRDSQPVEGWLWVVHEHARRIDNFEWQFSLLRDRPAHEEGAAYFALPEPLTLTQTLSLAVVFDGNVKALDERQKEDPDRQLTAKQEKTRDRLISALAVEYLGWRPWEEGKDFELASFLQAAEEVGLSMSRNCVKEHLRMAWERSLPGNPK